MEHIGQLDADDLQREAYNQEAARIRRFFSIDVPISKNSGETKAKERAHRALLDQLLQDPKY